MKCFIPWVKDQARILGCALAFSLVSLSAESKPVKLLNGDFAVSTAEDPSVRLMDGMYLWQT